MYAMNGTQTIGLKEGLLNAHFAEKRRKVFPAFHSSSTSQTKNTIRFIADVGGGIDMSRPVLACDAVHTYNDSEKFQYIIGDEGFLRVYESETKHPGMHWAQFYHTVGETEDESDQYNKVLTIPCGDMDVHDGKLSILTHHNKHTYEFKMKNGF